jgi:hypothetical protein
LAYPDLSSAHGNIRGSRPGGLAPACSKAGCGVFDIVQGRIEDFLRFGNIAILKIFFVFEDDEWLGIGDKRGVLALIVFGGGIVQRD